MSTVAQTAGELPISFWVWIVGVFIQTISISIIGTWWVGRLVEAIREEVRAQRKEVDQSITLIEAELRRELENSTNAARQALESFSRIYTKDQSELMQRWYELSIHVRDSYTPNKTFEKVIDEIKDTLKEGLDRLDARIQERKGS